MPKLTSTQPKVLMQKVRLGSIPKSQLVRSKAFVPDAAQVSTDRTQDVFAESPVLDENGQFKTIPETVSFDAKPYNPVKAGLLSGLVGGVLSGLATGFNPVAMIAGAVISGLAGGFAVKGDEVSLTTEKQVVTKPVLDGYTTYTTDSVFVPNRPRGLFQDGPGTQFTFVEKIKQKPIGEIEVAKVQHSKGNWLANFI